MGTRIRAIMFPSGRVGKPPLSAWSVAPLRHVGFLLLYVLAGSGSLARAECPGPPPVFGQNLVATDANTLSWALPADVDVGRGSLSHMGLYATWGRGSLNNATSLDISADNPSPGQGIFYL